MDQLATRIGRGIHRGWLTRWSICCHGVVTEKGRFGANAALGMRMDYCGFPKASHRAIPQPPHRPHRSSDTCCMKTSSATMYTRGKDMEIYHPLGWLVGLDSSILPLPGPRMYSNLRQLRIDRRGAFLPKQATLCRKRNRDVTTELLQRTYQVQADQQGPAKALLASDQGTRVVNLLPQGLVEYPPLDPKPVHTPGVITGENARAALITINIINIMRHASASWIIGQSQATPPCLPSARQRFLAWTASPSPWCPRNPLLGP